MYMRYIMYNHYIHIIHCVSYLKITQVWVLLQPPVHHMMYEYCTCCAVHVSCTQYSTYCTVLVFLFCCITVPVLYCTTTVQSHNTLDTELFMMKIPIN